MGKRGPSPEPTALKLLKGNPGRRPINRREPRPDPTTPTCPDWLDDTAKAKWAELVPVLSASGLLTNLDGDALANYCRTWSRWRAAEEFITKHGEVTVVKNKDGTAKCFMQLPQVSIARNLLLILNRYQGEFGLSPSSRSRIEVTPKAGPKSDFMGLIQGNKDG